MIFPLSVDRSQALACDVRSAIVFGKADPVTRTARQDILLYALAYLLWLINIVVCTVVVLEFRSTINLLWMTTSHSRWTLGLADQLSVLLGGLVLLFTSCSWRVIMVAASCSRASPGLSMTSRPPVGFRKG